MRHLGRRRRRCRRGLTLYVRFGGGGGGLAPGGRGRLVVVVMVMVVVVMMVHFAIDLHHHSVTHLVTTSQPRRAHSSSPIASQPKL